jgi:hypothetical protein
MDIIKKWGKITQKSLKNAQSGAKVPFYRHKALVFYSVVGRVYSRFKGRYIALCIPIPRARKSAKNSLIKPQRANEKARL